MSLYAKHLAKFYNVHDRGQIRPEVDPPWTSDFPETEDGSRVTRALVVDDVISMAFWGGDRERSTHLQSMVALKDDLWCYDCDAVAEDCDCWTFNRDSFRFAARDLDEPGVAVR